ncbi:MAG: hypothetical protein Q8K82_00030, partial [Gemmatimonadaceae bacterium]|nr:hypothetical protein [Gemmatimonadaceae bacterium]
MKTLRMWTAGLAVLLTACERAPMDATTRPDRDVDAARWANTVQQTANPSCTHRWGAGVNGSWFDATKWTPAAVPSVSDVACVDAAGTYTVTLDPVVDATPIDIAALNLGAASGIQTLRLSGSSLTLNVALGIEIAPNGSLLFANFTGGTVSATSVTNDGLLKKTAQCGGCGTSDAINADIVNNGTIDVFGDLTWGKPNGAYANTGAIVISGSPGIDIPAGTGAPTFAQNGGSVSAPTLAVLSMRAGTYTLNGGSIPPSVQSTLPIVRLEGATLVLGAALGNATLGIRSDASGNASVTGDVSATTTLWLMGAVAGTGIVTFVGSPTNFGKIRPDMNFFP